MANEMERIAESILKSKIPEEEKKSILKRMNADNDELINIMITGCTGCGKSSTINAMFNTSLDPSFARKERAKIGTGANPETMKITKYKLGNLVIWDSPGLGDGEQADIEHAKKIKKKLKEIDDITGNCLIDLILVIVDATSRDLGTTYELLSDVIIPVLGKEEAERRIIVGINKADVAKRGKEWDANNHCPKPKLEEYLKEQEQTIKNRIFESCGIRINAISYSAGYKPEDDVQEESYNLANLLACIIKYTPEDKRQAYFESVKWDSKNYESNSSTYVENPIEIAGDLYSDLTNTLGDALEYDMGLGGVGRAVGTVGGVAIGTAAVVGGVVAAPFVLAGKLLGDIFDL